MIVAPWANFARAQPDGSEEQIWEASMTKGKRKMRFTVRFVAIMAILASQAQGASFDSLSVELPEGLPELTAMRSEWGSETVGLVTEGFEEVGTIGENITFDQFSLSLSGSDFIYFSAFNPSTRTEGISALGFQGSGILTFDFLSRISSFSVEWSSIDSSSTLIKYSDDQGNILEPIFSVENDRSSAAFFGVTDISVSSISFAVSSIEALEFDAVQFSPEVAPVPTPASIGTMAFALFLLSIFRRGRTQNRL